MRGDESRRRQIAAGLGVIAGVSGLIVLIAMGRFLPGLGGEFFSRVLGIITTPFLMEASFCILGLVLVISINHWRQMKEGDELVYLEQVKDAPADLPGQARWAIYREAPLDGVQPPAPDLLEGALAIGDYEAAFEILDGMSAGERKHPDVLRQRIRLAQATGKDELVRRLQDELATETQ